LSSLSNPFGWGWNLLGTAGVAWQPWLMDSLLPLQTLVLVGGLIWSIRSAQKTGLQLQVSATPIAVFSALSTFLMLGLLV
jgi:hypothetical protein